MLLEDYKLTPEVQEILDVHEALWNKESTVQYRGVTATVYRPNHEGYSSVILPGSDGASYQWITQNMNKSSYGTSRIIRARAQGEDHRITWIIDNTEAKFTYIGRIESIRYPDGKYDATIDRYSGDLSYVYYTTNSLYKNKKSLY